MEREKNEIKCCNCHYGIPTSDSMKSWYCDAHHFGYGKKNKGMCVARKKTHGSRFSCGKGVYYSVVMYDGPVYPLKPQNL